MSDYDAISDVVDTGRRRSLKRYCIRVPTGTTQAQIETQGYFEKYDLRGWKAGDLVEVLSDFGILGYEITGEDANDTVIISLLYFFTNAAGLIDATEVPMAPVLAVGPATGETDVQAAITALNTAVDALSVSNIVASIVASPTLVSQIWGAILANHWSFDGTTLCMDYNNDGNPAA